MATKLSKPEFPALEHAVSCVSEFYGNDAAQKAREELNSILSYVNRIHPKIVAIAQLVQPAQNADEWGTHVLDYAAERLRRSDKVQKLVRQPGLIDQLLTEIDISSRAENSYEYGLPRHNEGQMALLREIVIRWLSEV